MQLGDAVEYQTRPDSLKTIPAVQGFSINQRDERGHEDLLKFQPPELLQLFAYILNVQPPPEKISAEVKLNNFGASLLDSSQFLLPPFRVIIIMISQDTCDK